MISVRKGDLLESDAQTLVNTVNIVGVMGKGIALQFRKAFPDMHREYVERCRAGQVRLGKPYLWVPTFGHWVLNFPTKDHWRSVAKLADIEDGLRHLEAHYKEWGIQSLAVPPLGCGEGQLEWSVVGPTLYRYFKRFDIPVEMYAPFGTPPGEMTEEFLAGLASPNAHAQTRSRAFRVSPGAYAVVEALARIDREPYHWPVGRTMLQKLAYFATEKGIPTGLRYVRGSFGPYASDLRRLLTKLVNNGLIVEERRGNMLVSRPGPTYADAARTYASYVHQWDEAIDDVVDLFLRFDTKQAEIAATVYFVAQDLGTNSPASEMDLLDRVKEWKSRRNPPLNDGEIASSIRNLNSLGWLSVVGSNALPVDDVSRHVPEEAEEGPSRAGFSSGH